MPDIQTDVKDKNITSRKIKANKSSSRKDDSKSISHDAKTDSILNMKKSTSAGTKANSPEPAIRNSRPARGNSIIRRDVISSVTEQIKRSNLSSHEMLALVQAFGITPIYTRFRNRNGETQINFPDNIGPLQYLLGQFGNVTQRLATFRKLVYDGAKVSEKDLELLSLINASDYDQFGNPVTPQIFLPVLEKIREIFSEVDERVIRLQQTRRNSGSGGVAPVKKIEVA